MSLPNLITVIRDGRDCRILIDDEEFPALNAVLIDPGVQVDVNANNVPSITLTLGARRVEVTDSIERA